jgi:hypothetical protein
MCRLSCGDMCGVWRGPCPCGGLGGVWCGGCEFRVAVAASRAPGVPRAAAGVATFAFLVRFIMNYALNGIRAFVMP